MKHLKKAAHASAVKNGKNLFNNQVHHQRDGHADATDADEALDELVAFFALQETAEIAADPGAACHDDGDGPVDFASHAERNGTYHQEHVGEGIFESVNLDWRKSGVARESKNLHESDTNLHDAAVNGDGEKSESAFEGQLFRRIFRRLSQNILVQVAHDNHEADDDCENCLEQLVADMYQEARSKKGTENCRCEQLQEDALVQVAMTGQVECATEISDNEPDTVRAVCNGCRHPEENHDRKALGRAAARDAVDKADHGA